MTTIKDVATAAGVKPATVSYVLNGTGAVSTATRARVLAAAASLQYRPSFAARSLQRRETRTLGLVIPPERDPSTWGQIVSGLVDTATEQGYELLLRTTAGHSESYLLDELVQSRRVDGVVILQAADGPAQQFSGAACVYGGSRDQHPSVRIDNEAGVVEAVAHLVAQGYQRIGLITPPLEWPLADEQDAGLRSAIDDAGLAFEPAWVVEGGLTESEGYDAAVELLAQPERPDALIAGLASLAFGCLRAVRDAGLQVGPDIAVIACEEPRAAAYIDPPLTALRQPYYEFGGMLAHTLIQVVRGEPAADHVLFPQLIVRHSCGE